MSLRADILFTGNRTAVLSYWSDYWLVAAVGLKGQAIKLEFTAQTQRFFVIFKNCRRLMKKREHSKCL
jgi:hypothetical protein